MKYLFVLSAEGGWWLKIDTIEQLIDYHKKTDGHRYEKALWNFFHGVKPIEFTQFYRREELVFPNFTEDDIHIKQYGEKGIHWYAYIGDMQLHYGDKRKWNTYEAAKEYAYSILKLC